MIRIWISLFYVFMDIVFAGGVIAAAMKHDVLGLIFCGIGFAIWMNLTLKRIWGAPHA